MTQNKQTPEQRLEALRKELAKLKEELKKTRSTNRRAILYEEMRGVCREIEKLQH